MAGWVMRTPPLVRFLQLSILAGLIGCGGQVATSTETGGDSGQGRETRSSTGAAKCSGDEVLANGKCMSCEQWAKVNSAALDRLWADPVYRDCSRDIECVRVPGSTACAVQCGTVVVAHHVEDFAAALAQYGATYCQDQRAPEVCPWVPPPCEPAHRVPTCTWGLCVWGPRLVEGAPVEEARGCLGEPQIAGASESERAWPLQGETYAIDPDGRCWLLTTAPEGLPSTFTEAPEDAPLPRGDRELLAARLAGNAQRALGAEPFSNQLIPSASYRFTGLI